MGRCSRCGREFPDYLLRVERGELLCIWCALRELESRVESLEALAGIPLEVAELPEEVPVEEAPPPAAAEAEREEAPEVPPNIMPVSLEVKIGREWFLRAGVVLVVAALAYLYEHVVLSRLGPWGYVGTGVAAGVATAAAGEFWAPKTSGALSRFMRVMIALGGLSTVVSLWAMASYFRLTGPEPFVLLSLATSMYLAWAFKRHGTWEILASSLTSGYAVYLYAASLSLPRWIPTLAHALTSAAGLACSFEREEDLPAAAAAVGALSASALAAAVGWGSPWEMAIAAAVPPILILTSRAPVVPWLATLTPPAAAAAAHMFGSPWHSLLFVPALLATLPAAKGGQRGLLAAIAASGSLSQLAYLLASASRVDLRAPLSGVPLVGFLAALAVEGGDGGRESLVPPSLGLLIASVECLLVDWGPGSVLGVSALVAFGVASHLRRGAVAPTAVLGPLVVASLSLAGAPAPPLWLTYWAYAGAALTAAWRWAREGGATGETRDLFPAIPLVPGQLALLALPAGSPVEAAVRLASLFALLAYSALSKLRLGVRGSGYTVSILFTYVTLNLMSRGGWGGLWATLLPAWATFLFSLMMWQRFGDVDAAWSQVGVPVAVFPAYRGPMLCGPAIHPSLGEAVTAALLLVSASLAAAAEARDEPTLRPISALILLPTAFNASYSWSETVHAALAGAALACSLAYAASALMSRERGELAVYLLSTYLAFGLLAFSTGLPDWTVPTVPLVAALASYADFRARGPGTCDVLLAVGSLTSAGSALTVFEGGPAASAFLAASGAAAVALGIPERSRVARVSGLALLIAGILKALTHDLVELGLLSRGLSLLAVGAALIGISYLYARYQDVILREGPPVDDSAR